MCVCARARTHTRSCLRVAYLCTYAYESAYVSPCGCEFARARVRVYVCVCVCVCVSAFSREDEEMQGKHDLHNSLFKNFFLNMIITDMRHVRQT